MFVLQQNRQGSDWFVGWHNHLMAKGGRRGSNTRPKSQGTGSGVIGEATVPSERTLASPGSLYCNVCVYNDLCTLKKGGKGTSL